MATTETKEKLVPVFLDLLDGANAPTEEFVGFNGKAYLIKRGEEVMVPEGVYNVLMESKKVRARNIATKNATSLKNE
jgi:hypothetical protein